MHFVPCWISLTNTIGGLLEVQAAQGHAKLAEGISLLIVRQEGTAAQSLMKNLAELGLWPLSTRTRSLATQLANLHKLPMILNLQERIKCCVRCPSNGVGLPTTDDGIAVIRKVVFTTCGGLCLDCVRRDNLTSGGDPRCRAHPRPPEDLIYAKCPKNGGCIKARELPTWGLPDLSARE